MGHCFHFDTFSTVFDFTHLQYVCVYLLIHFQDLFQIRDTFSIKRRSARQAPSTRIRVFLKPHLFHSNRPFVHTKPVNPVTETVSFLNRSTQWFKTLSTRFRIKKICVFKRVRIRVDMALMWCYTGRFATTTIFGATQRCNVGTMLQVFKTMSQQCCNAVLCKKSSLRIVSCNITFRMDGRPKRPIVFQHYA